jgi:hypothetical protein
MKSLLALSCVLVALVTGTGAQRPQQPPNRALPRFVQSFYDWYTPRARKTSGRPSWYVALSLKSSLFARPLLRALRADSEAQSRAQGEIVGLGFDPLLNSQDPCDRYEVGRTTHRNQTYWVEIHSVCAGRRSGSPRLTAELVLRDRSWVFVNFHYPREHTDVLAALRLARRARSGDPVPRARPH